MLQDGKAESIPRSALSCKEDADLLPEEDNSEEPESAFQIWLEEHKLVVYGTIATGAAAAAALIWIFRRH